MAMFMTKVWGFSEPCGPLVFRLDGLRKNAIEMLQPGDRVILVATMGREVEPGDRGRILGMMEPTRHPVASLDFELVIRPVDRDEQGSYRWPFGLLIRRAWAFDHPRPLLGDLTDRTFHIDAAQGIVPILAEEEARILRRPLREVRILTSARANARIEGHDVARRRGAPPPTATRHGVMHLRNAPAYTYLMEVRNRKVVAYKVGWAFDVLTRQRQFNLHAMPALDGVEYKAVEHQLWDTARHAFQMEQEVLRLLDRHRHPGNREIITDVTEDDMLQAWRSSLLTVNRRSAGRR